MTPPELVPLRDGTVVVVRPIEPTDAAALVAFHDGLSPESTRLRYFSPHPCLSSTEIHRLTHVDHLHREALVAKDRERIVAVGRYERLPVPGTVEVAFVVAEDWRNRGLASKLFRRLATLAAERGCPRIVADTLGENRAMAAVFLGSGLPEHHTLRDGVAHYEMRVTTDPSDEVT